MTPAKSAGWISSPPAFLSTCDSTTQEGVEDLGGFAAADVHVLKNGSAAQILDAVDLLAAGAPASVFVFYFSGHADAGALHPAGTLLPLDLLLHRLRAVRAELRLSILDACQSGAAARPVFDTCVFEFYQPLRITQTILFQALARRLDLFAEFIRLPFKSFCRIFRALRFLFDFVGNV